MLFKDCQFYSKIINRVASAVFAMYLFEGTIRKIVNCFIELQMYSNNSVLPFAITLYVIIVMIICYIVEIFRQKTIARIEPNLIMLLNSILKRIEKAIDNLENNVLHIVR